MACQEQTTDWSRRAIMRYGACALLCMATYIEALAVEKKRWTIAIKKGKVDAEKSTIRVNQGDKVDIEFTSDRAIVLHLHGIDIEISLTRGKPAVMSFEATVSGRFPIEVHGAGRHGGLVYVEVYPR